MAFNANSILGTSRLVVAGSLVACLTTIAYSQRMTEPTVEIRHITSDFAVGEIDHREWKRANEVEISTYWNAEAAPRGRRAKARLLWSDSALYVRFEANRDEPLIVSEKPQLAEKTMRLWDRDVVEIFLAPDRSRKYLEFEVAPTGEWIDLAIDYTGTERKTDWDFRSGMTSAARVEKEKIFMTMRIPWSAFGAVPKGGDVWVGNLFRCVGKDPTRGYLAWSPTMTAQANFHVPEKFGQFVFAK